MRKGIFPNGKMLGASLLPARWQPADENAQHGRPTWLNRQLQPCLANISKRATVHPIYTIVCVAVLASTTYLGLLESSLFERHTAVLGAGGNVDFDSLFVGSKTLYTNAENGWSWSLAGNGSDKQIDDVRRLQATQKRMLDNEWLTKRRTLP